MRAAIVGVGAVGARAARQLLTLGAADRLTIADRDKSRAEAVARSLGSAADAVDLASVPFGDCDVAVLAHPAPEDRAREALRAGSHVVVTSGLLRTARSLAGLDAEARERGRNVVIGAALSPGLSCVLVKEAARRLDRVTSVEVAAFGAGGPACASERRAALASTGLRWDGAWHDERGGSGRRLAVFPDPVGQKDCFSAGTAETFLLTPAFPRARVSSTVAATLPERLTAGIPTLRREPADGTLGAVRVEVHGVLATGEATASVLGLLDRPALASGAVAAVAARWAAADAFSHPGAAGLAELVDDSTSFLRELAVLGVRAAEFVGS